MTRVRQGTAESPIGAALPGVAPAMSAVTYRPGRPEDAEACGRICYEAFREIATRHRFPPDFSDAEAAGALFRLMLGRSDVDVVVAERDGRILGSNALWAGTPIAGVGPITVTPEVQDAALGRALMAHVLERAAARSSLGVRLVQAAYHNRSLALYTKLGFDAREPLTVIQGAAVGASMPDRHVRPARDEDVAACAALHESLHGYSRAAELRGAVAGDAATVVERGGRICGYATGIGFFGHAIGEETADVIALIAAAGSYDGPGFLAPTRNGPLLRWCLEHGLRLVQPMTLMTRGFYRDPGGAYLPSILF